jgi:hypothetical protein
MPPCSHAYRDPHAPCPHTVPPGGTLCIWHNPLVRKHGEYIPALLAQADAMAKGDLSDFSLAGLLRPRAALALRNLSGADLRDAFLDDSDLSGADLQGAVLRRASLKGADLRHARLHGADLTGANLSGADLRHADLTGCLLDGTILLAADLRQADVGGAILRGFHWNRLTRFAGITGLCPASSVDGEADETQSFPAPLALADHASGDVSALQDALPELTRTRLFAPLPATPRSVHGGIQDDAQRVAWPDADPVVGGQADAATPASRASRPAWYHRPTLLAAASLALVIGAAVGSGGVLLGRAWLAASLAPAVASALPGMPAAGGDHPPSQHDADLLQLRQLQTRAQELADQVAVSRRDAAVQRAEAERLRLALADSENDVARLRGVEDQALLLTQRLAEARQVSADLARQSSQQDRLAAILSSGVERLQRDNAALASDRDRWQSEAQKLGAQAAHASELADRLASISRQRDDFAQDNQHLRGELQDAQQQMQRCLARIDAAHLQDYLGTDEHQAPLVPVVAGQPIALSGEYLMTVRVDPGHAANTVDTQVVVQRPPGTANPEVSVVLFDQDRHPLRRIAYGFPHVDAGAPFVCSQTSIACDRFPAFVRIVVAPGLDELAAQR